MDAFKMAAPVPGASAACLPFAELPEEEQIALLIKLFDLGPVLKTPRVIAVTGDTRTDFYARQDPDDELFDPTYPKPRGGRRSNKTPRSYWTVDILRWDVRRTNPDRR